MTVDVKAIPGLPRAAATAEFWPWANSFTMVSQLTRDQQSVALPGVLWRANLQMPPMDEPQWRQWSAFIASLSGTAGRFNVMPPHAPQPQGVEAPTVYSFTDGTGFDDGTGFFDPPYPVKLRADVASSKILFRTYGWPVSQRVLRRGDFVSWANGKRRMMVMLDKDARSDASGNADLQLCYPAPETPRAGQRLYPWWPSVTMRLIDDDQARQSWTAPKFSRHTFEAVEASPYGPGQTS